MAYSKYNTSRFQAPKPVDEGGEYNIEIEGLGTKGDGIGRIKGFVVIVPNVKVGDKVKIKVTAIRGKVAFGEVVGEADAAPENSAEENSDSAETPEAESAETNEAEAEETKESDAEPEAANTQEPEVEAEETKESDAEPEEKAKESDAPEAEPAEKSKEKKKE